MQEEKRNECIKTVSVIKPAVRETHTEALHLNTTLGGEKKCTCSTLLCTLSVPYTQQKVVNVHVGKYLKDWWHTHIRFKENHRLPEKLSEKRWS